MLGSFLPQDGSASHKPVTAIKNHSLSSGYGPLGILKMNPDLSLIKDFHPGRTVYLMVSNPAHKSVFRFRILQPVKIFCDQFCVKEIFIAS